MHVNPVEAVWILLNFSTLVLTLSALADARADQAAVKLLNGHAREVAAAGIVRREALRLLMQLLLLAIVIPRLFVEGDTPATVGVVVVMLIPLILLVSSLLDARDRKAMTIVVAADVSSDSARSRIRMEDLTREILDAIAANTEISQKASDSADAAYHEANSVNEKIKLQGDELVIQGKAILDDRAKRTSDSERMEGTVDDTHDKVVDLHDQLPGES
jgi:hypothetical protein